jgi:hypothetical protein
MPSGTYLTFICTLCGSNHRLGAYLRSIIIYIYIFFMCKAMTKESIQAIEIDSVFISFCLYIYIYIYMHGHHEFIARIVSGSSLDIGYHTFLNNHMRVCVIHEIVARVSQHSHYDRKVLIYIEMNQDHYDRIS